MKQFLETFSVISYKDGVTEIAKFGTLETANTSVREFATANNLIPKLDGEGWLSCADNEESPSTEAYLLSETGVKRKQYLECCEIYGKIVVHEAIGIVETTGEPDGAWSLMRDMCADTHAEIIEILYFEL